jgi:hypothetical protein
MTSVITRATSADEVKNALEASTFIFYKGKRLLNAKLIQDYENDFNGDIALIIKKVSSNQTLVITDKTRPEELEKSE